MPKKAISFLLVSLLLLAIMPSLVLANSLVQSFRPHDWTYQAIHELSEGREIPGFSLPKELNRNQGALLVSRLLQHLAGDDHLESRRFGISKNVYLDNMIFTYNQKVPETKALTANQVELLYRLVLEFHQELEILGFFIQDFELLYSQNWSAEKDGLFSRTPLLYSEQAIAAARKLEQEKRITEILAEVEPDDDHFISELTPLPVEPRNLWTAQNSSVTRYLPPASYLSWEEPSAEASDVLQIGGLEVSAALRQGAQTDQAAEQIGGGAGYGISMKMGDLALQTAIDLAVDPDLRPKMASTSIDLSVDWAELFTLNAGYKQQEAFKKNKGEDPLLPITTSVGVVVPMNSGQVHLGMSQEWGNYSLETGSTSLDNESATVAAKNTAELGLSYKLNNDSSLQLNYRLIDFSKIEEENHEASAAFSIKF